MLTMRGCILVQCKASIGCGFGAMLLGWRCGGAFCCWCFLASHSSTCQKCARVEVQVTTGQWGFLDVSFAVAAIELVWLFDWGWFRMEAKRGVEHGARIGWFRSARMFFLVWLGLAMLVVGFGSIPFHSIPAAVFEEARSC